MPQCYDNWKREYVNCTSQLGAYIAVGVIIPVSILVVIALIGFYRRYRFNRHRREQQQISMNAVVSIYNSDEQQQAPYNYPYPPHYTAATNDLVDKPPSYEQTVQQLSEVHPTSDNSAAILPVTTVTSSSQSVPPSRNGP